MRAREFIRESGAALTKLGTQAKRINQQEFYDLKKKLDPILTKAGLNAKFKMGWTMGSAGSWDPKHPYYHPGTVKKDAGDVDVMVDASDLMDAFPPAFKKYRQEPKPEKKFADQLKSSKEQLAAWLEQNGIPNTGSSLNLDVDGVQVDLIVKKDAASTIHGHQLDYSKDVGMRGTHLWMDIWPALIKMNPSPITGKTTIGDDPKTGEPISALQLSPDKGVVDRETGKVVFPWSQKDKIAELMVGKGVTGKDISSISGLKAALQKVAPEKWNAVKHFFAALGTK